MSEVQHRGPNSTFPQCRLAPVYAEKTAEVNRKLPPVTRLPLDLSVHMPEEQEGELCYATTQQKLGTHSPRKISSFLSRQITHLTIGSSSCHVMSCHACNNSGRTKERWTMTYYLQERKENRQRHVFLRFRLFPSVHAQRQGPSSSGTIAFLFVPHIPPLPAFLLPPLARKKRGAKQRQGKEQV